MISFLLFYLIGIPASVLIHEIGHAVGALLFSKEKVHVYLGPGDASNKENFRIGRMHFHIKLAYYGFCAVKNRNDFTKAGYVIFLAGGPLFTLLLVIAASLVSAELTHFGAKNFLNGIFFANFTLFIFTSIPVIYPNWLKPYAGRPSDGYQILTTLKTKI